jgi:hypothetical protein
MLVLTTSTYRWRCPVREETKTDTFYINGKPYSGSDQPAWNYYFTTYAALYPFLRDLLVQKKPTGRYDSKKVKAAESFLKSLPEWGRNGTPDNAVGKRWKYDELKQVLNANEGQRECSMALIRFADALRADPFRESPLTVQDACRALFDALDLWRDDCLAMTTLDGLPYLNGTKKLRQLYRAKILICMY